MLAFLVREFLKNEIKQLREIYHMSKIEQRNRVAATVRNTRSWFVKMSTKDERDAIIAYENDFAILTKKMKLLSQKIDEYEKSFKLLNLAINDDHRGN